MNVENENFADPAQSADEEEIQLAARLFCNGIIAKNGTLNVQKGWHVRKQSFMCDICMKILFNQRSLKSHMERHEKDNKYSKFDNEATLETHLKLYAFSCERCSEMFMTEIELGRHVEICHESCAGKDAVHGNVLESALSVETPGGSSGSTVVQNISNQPELSDAERKEMEQTESSVVSGLNDGVKKARENVCKFCGKIFKKKGILDVHITNWHISSKKKFECKVCFKELSASHSLRNHMSKKHGVEIGKERKFSCNYCPKRFTSEVRLQTHCESESHLPAADTAGGSRQNVQEMTDVKVDGESSVQTELKNSPTNDLKTELNASVRPKNEDTCSTKPFRCTLCSKQLVTRQALEYHLLHKHQSKKRRSTKPFRCGVCSTSLGTPQALKYHLLHKHNSNKNVGKPRHFKCKYCSKKYASEARLRIHRKIHNQHSQCYVCDEIFADGATLQTHVATHRKKTVDCPYCGSTFDSKSELDYHIKSTGENLFICSTCFEAFENYLAFKYHILVHNKEEIFICTLCDKTFVTDGELAQHIGEHR